MKKFYDKKDVEQEETPILKRIERRQTLTELAKEIKSDQWHEMAVRTLSSRSSRQNDLSRGCSNSSANSTFVITDSDLASSWIYSSRREAANEVFQPPQENLELQEPSSCPTYTVSSSKRCSKVCCYIMVSTIITLCAIGILSTIGGIIYLEVFAKPTAHDGQPSLKLTGFHLTNESPDVGNGNFIATTSDQQTGYSDIKDFGKHSHTTSQSSESGKVLLHDEFTTPDLNVLRSYVNGTIHVMKNVIQMIRNTSIQNSNSPEQDLPTNRRGRNTLASDSSQGLFRKLTSFLFGSVNRIGENKINKMQSSSDHDKALASSTERSFALSSNKVQSEEFASGDIDGGSEHFYNDFSTKVITPMQVGIFSKIQTSPVDIETTHAVDLGSNGNSPSLEDLFGKRVDKDLEITPETHGIETIDAGSSDSSLEQKKASRALEGEHVHSDMRRNVSASIAGLFKLFKTIDRIKSSVNPPTSTEPQENLFQVRISEAETEPNFETNYDSASQERDQYLQRLRNIVFMGDVVP